MDHHLKIITLNLRHDADRWLERLPLIVDGLVQQAADVVAFQEVALPIHQAHLIAQAVNERSGSAAYQVYLQPKWGDQPTEGIAILSRWPVVQQASIDLPEGHRVAQRIQMQWGNSTFNIVNTHLHHLPEDDESIRYPQATAILTWIASFTAGSRGTILMGDFNAEPQSSTIRKISEVFQAAPWATSNQGINYTFPTPLVAGEWSHSCIIDYIFVEPRYFRVNSARLAFTEPHAHDTHLYPSDHFGLLAEVASV